MIIHIFDIALFIVLAVLAGVIAMQAGKRK